MKNSAFRVALTMRQEAHVYDSGPEWRDSISHDWLSFLKKERIEVRLIPNLAEDHCSYLEGIDLLILSGGGDLSTERPDSFEQRIESRRDRAEFALLECALSRPVPVLGVCRGMQQIQRYFGGKLVTIEPAMAHVGCAHQIKIDSQSRFLPSSSATVLVNSYHHYAVESVNPPLRIVARSDDHTIEAIEHHELPILGIMWHPERQGGDAITQQFHSQLLINIRSEL